MSDERGRIEFLVARDGLTQAHAWVQRTAGIYREALRASAHASNADYRRELERAVHEFDEWLATQEGAAVAHAQEQMPSQAARSRAGSAAPTSQPPS